MKLKGQGGQNSHICARYLAVHTRNAKSARFFGTSVSFVGQVAIGSNNMASSLGDDFTSFFDESFNEKGCLGQRKK